MKRKDFFAILITALFSLPLLAEENEIALRIKPGHESGSRTLEDIVTASIDEQVLTASFTDVTASSIVVYDETDPYTVLLNQRYAPAYSAQVNLTLFYVIMIIHVHV